MQAAEVTLAPESASVGAARRFLLATLRQWSLEPVEWNAAQVVSELVTNAVLHAGTTVTLSLRPEADGLRIEVRDRSRRALTRRRYGLSATTGRGLALVAALSSEWGVEPSDDGKTVWSLVRAPYDDDGEPDLAAFLSREDAEELRSSR
jgi:anti-sigma regulatory factor (Ser/Thr protein kinase)